MECLPKAAWHSHTQGSHTLTPTPIQTRAIAHHNVSPTTSVLARDVFMRLTVDIAQLREAVGGAENHRRQVLALPAAHAVRAVQPRHTDAALQNDVTISSFAAPHRLLQCELLQVTIPVRDTLPKKTSCVSYRTL